MKNLLASAILLLSAIIVSHTMCIAGQVAPDVAHNADEETAVIAADVLNAGIYAYNGNYAMAGLSLTAAIPVIGDGIKGAAKITKAAGNVASAATAMGRSADNGATAAGGTTNTVQGANANAVQGACFTEGTQIVVGMEFTDDGVFVQYVTMNIEDVRVGDLVYSYNTLTGEVELREVIATFVRQSDHINHLAVVGEDGNEQLIETTDSHPFWVVTDEPDLERAARAVVDENGLIIYHDNIEPGLNGFWVEAKDLRIGDVFLGANGELSTLTGLMRVEQSGGIAVFNFEVAGNHNYFVIAKNVEGATTAVLAHNMCATASNIGWIKHGTYNEIRKQFGKKGVDEFVTAMKKGIVGPKDASGIKALTGVVKIGSKIYTHEIKVFNKGIKDWRVLGYFNEHGRLIFDKLQRGFHK